MSCSAGCNCSNCCQKIVFRKGYSFKKRYVVKSKSTNSPIDFTGRRVVAQIRKRKSSETKLTEFVTLPGNGFVTAGAGFIEINVPAATIDTFEWDSAYMEIAVEWTSGVPEYQFSAPVNVVRGLVP